jgi:RimJ/RimL family protein N-acetyltransferase
MNITLQKIGTEQAQKWLDMQIAAYMPLLLKYKDYDISPATESLNRILERLNWPFGEHFFIMQNGEPVGGVRVYWWDGTARYKLGGIFILPEFQNYGIGQIAMQLVQSNYPQAGSWELETLLQEERNLHFYEKLGFVRDGDLQVVNDKLTLVGYKKAVETALKEGIV